ncbi:MAG TPA: heavy metal translocating P-type ATPase [Acholeplasma sp.]|nr:heavy metal translocating P-type ATPase [Acholeplasma sp.]
MKKRLRTTGITCTNCAFKIESDIKKIEGMNDVSINVVNQTISFESTKEVDPKQIDKIIKSHEKHAGIVEKNKEVGIDKILLIRLVTSMILVIVASFLGEYRLYSYVIAYLIVGYDVLYKAVNNIFKGRMLDEHFLMGIATIGAFIINEGFEAVLVMLFYQIGELFQSVALSKSRKAISDLIDFKVNEVFIIEGNAHIKKDILDVKVDEILYVRPGDVIGLDGIIIEGHSDIDSKAMTGESKYASVKPGDLVTSGIINVTGLIKIKVLKPYVESTTYKLVEMLENATSNKAKTEKFMTKFARIYTPIVVGIALMIVLIPSILYGDFNEWLYRGLIFLVISCPCALVISIPLGYFGGLGLASKKGVLIKGSNYLEGLNEIDMVLFDKTGTLSKSKFVIKSERKNDEHLYEVVKMAEYYANHPIKEAFSYEDIDVSRISEFKNHPGKGIELKIDNESCFVGNELFLKEKGFDVFASNEPYTEIHAAMGTKYLGLMLLKDELKDEAHSVVNELKGMGYKVGILSGDHEDIVKVVAEELGISIYHANMSPSDKLDMLKSYQESHKILYIGDGTNDSLVLMQSNIGASMGQMGSDIALEASDIVYMHDDLNQVLDGFKIAKRTRRIVYENIFLAIIIKVVFLSLGAFGLSSMLQAVFADVGVAIIAILNALRTIYSKK